MMTRRVVRRRPEDQHADLLVDVVVSMVHTGRDKDQAAGFHWSILIRHANRTTAVDHVVDLVLFMWPLAVGRAGGPNRQADAELFRREHVDVAVTIFFARLRIELRYLVRFHCCFTATTILQISTRLGGTAWLRSAGRTRFGKAT